MAEPACRSQTRVEFVRGLHRRAPLPLGHTAEFGVHGPVKELFRLNPDRGFPLPVGYIVAATLRGSVNVSWTAEIVEA